MATATAGAMMPAWTTPGSKVMELAAKIEARAIREVPPRLAADATFREALHRACIAQAQQSVSEPVQ